ncbi:conserved phage C-terminal domain-containing protein [Paraburkholderia acidisoli]|uniref:Phage conserved hypothetical protein C-terminal domain-containing protein n=1 Tax=Paraburkholderia acidisoli TaxID=2571748 RepID=A0A7Z2GR16_9BURK|nr:conserved phage C-terminal domain-containing protein [Paraburkholderia acidisoli]QGZ66300.1 hypothetical protein FAZ98_31390 [Paraburkholderia acidisoli]QGZ66388.1 hypothetical protein FAZ98_31885 [Paraburkholderia acidisoli]
MDWLRWWHGTVNDPKFGWVARKSGQTVASVIAVWAALLECASNATQCNADATRGNVASFDCNDYDVAFGLDDGSVRKIFDAMVEKNLIVDGRLARWEDRQPKREDSGNPNTGALSSTERSRKHRDEKKRYATDATQMQHDATLGNDRLDKSREDKEKHMSGEPDVAKAILAHLNEKSGRSYKPVESNLKLIRARLKEGATEADCVAVIDAKTDEWLNDEKWSQYLRPETLFNATKFASYVGQLGQSNVVPLFASGEKYL